MTREQAIRIRALVEKASASLDHAEAYEARCLFPAPVWDGRLIAAGTRLQWNGALVCALSDLWATESNAPDQVPALWEIIEYHEGFRVLLGPISASNPVKPGEMCWENGTLYQNISAAPTVYRPGEYPNDWKEVTQA